MSANRFLMPVAVHLLLIQEGKILLLRRFNTGYEDGNYSVIAGHLDGNEDIKSAMIREAREEAGIVISPNNIEIVSAMHRKSNDERIDFFLTTKLWDGPIMNMEPEKCDELSWYDIDSIPDNVIPYIKKAIENYKWGIQFDKFGW